MLAAMMLVLAVSSAVQARVEEAVRRNNFGAELLRQGKPSEAIAEFRQAVTLDPDYAPAWRNLGFALDKQGQVDGAVAAYQKAVALEPDLNTHNNLGVLYDKQGRYEQAIQEFEKALKLDPANATVLKNLETARRNQGITKERNDRIAQAQKEAEARPSDPRAAYNLARIYASFDEKDNAFTWLAKALQLGFDDLEFVKTDPVLAGLRTDRRFERILETRGAQ
ncbi:MAG: tetratricopeptide repeat protein [Candidatus Methylomirabilota bacterium]